VRIEAQPRVAVAGDRRKLATSVVVTSLRGTHPGQRGSPGHRGWRVRDLLVQQRGVGRLDRASHQVLTADEHLAEELGVAVAGALTSGAGLSRELERFDK